MAKFQTELGGQQSVTRQSEGEGTNTKAAMRGPGRKRGCLAVPKLRGRAGSRDGRVGGDGNIQMVRPH